MGNSTQYSLPPVTLAQPSNVKIGKINLPVIGTTYSYPLQNNVQTIQICSASNATKLEIRFANTGEYKPIWKGCEYEITGINFYGKVLYIRGNAVDDVIITEFY